MRPRLRGLRACRAVAAEFRASLHRNLLASRHRALEQRSFGRAGADDIDVDIVARKLARERFRKRDYRALASGVDRLAQRADAPGVGGNRDDLAVAMRLHSRDGRLAAVEDAAIVDRDNPVPGLGRAFDEGLELVP